MSLYSFWGRHILVLFGVFFFFFFFLDIYIFGRTFFFFFVVVVVVCWGWGGGVGGVEGVIHVILFYFIVLGSTRNLGIF